jgi:integrase
MFLTKDSKSPFFQINYCKNGKRTKKSTKSKIKEEALKVLEQFKKELNSIDEKIIVSLLHFGEEYLTYCKNSRSKSYVERSIVPAFKKLNTFIGDVPINQITACQVDKFITSIFNYSNSAAGLYYRTLKAAFTKAVTWNYLKENPFCKIKSPKVPKSFPDYISETELILILDNTATQLCRDIFTTAFYTGMRLGELLNMKWNWIDFSQNVITIKNSDEFNTKNKRERIIPIHPKVNQILKRIISIGRLLQENYVFHRYVGVKLNEDFISKQFKKAVRQAGLKDGIHFHTLRHSFASVLVQRGVSLYAVKELLGHESIKTTQVYSHLHQDNLLKAINLL